MSPVCLSPLLKKEQGTWGSCAVTLHGVSGVTLLQSYNLLRVQLAFTGSTEVGKIIMKQAAEHIIPGDISS